MSSRIRVYNDFSPMRLAALVASALLVLSASTAPQRRAEPFVPVAVSYDPATSLEGNLLRTELEAIRALGFNSIKTRTAWSVAEPIRGQYRFESLHRVLAAADEIGLKIILEIDASPAPDWLLRIHPDARCRAVSNSEQSYCFDHPDVRNAVMSFIGAASERAAQSPSVYAVDVGSSDFLKLKVEASSPRGASLVISHSAAPSVLQSHKGAQDDWSISTLVDQYGTTIPPTPGGPSRLLPALDGIRSATRDRGWWANVVMDGEASTEADLRLWSWSALSRGARALILTTSESTHAEAMPGRSVSIADRRRAAAQFAGVVSRNPALFAPLRPRPAKVAVVYNRLSEGIEKRPAGPGSTSQDSMSGFYQAMLERNIQADFIHPDEIVGGVASRYGLVFLGYPLSLSRPVVQALDAFVRAGGTLVSEARPAAIDEHGRHAATVPGSGLDELFGAREVGLSRPATVTMLGEPALEGDFAPFAGLTLAGSDVAEPFEVIESSTRVLARFPGRNGKPGHPAIVMSRRGSGRAVLIGSYLAAAFARNPERTKTNGEWLGRLAALAGVTPDVRIAGARGLVETRFLESSDVIMIIGLNHTDTAQRVTMTFAPDTQEAIWQNMETGSGVNFVAGPDGPAYTCSFRPKDTLVLMIRKAVR
jgi:Beta-galactosidase trimerisation domain/Beta-galactosidase